MVSQRLHQDDISGTWLGSQVVDSTGLSYTYQVKLKARVTYWRGSSTITRQECQPGTSNGRGYEHSFKVMARRQGSYVLVWLLGEDQASSSLASGLFFLDDRGRTLRGRWVYRRESGPEVGVEEVILRKT